MTPDLGNAIFEFGGALTIWKAVHQLYQDKKIRGVWWPAWLFYAAWGIWNLWYYPTLGQWWSFLSGIVLVIGNITWCVMAHRYRKN